MDGDLHGGSACLCYSTAHARLSTGLPGLTCLGVFASTGAALADCPAQSVSTPFSQWGDTTDYFLVPGGSFEGTPARWGGRCPGASLTAGNEPFHVDGSHRQTSR